MDNIILGYFIACILYDDIFYYLSTLTYLYTLNVKYTLTLYVLSIITCYICNKKLICIIKFIMFIVTLYTMKIDQLLVADGSYKLAEILINNW